MCNLDVLKYCVCLLSISLSFSISVLILSLFLYLCLCLSLFISLFTSLSLPHNNSFDVGSQGQQKQHTADNNN